MHSERLAYIERLNNERELSVEDVAALIADSRRYETALHNARTEIARLRKCYPTEVVLHVLDQIAPLVADQDCDEDEGDGPFTTDEVE